jgi:hypothetical protein
MALCRACRPDRPGDTIIRSPRRAGREHETDHPAVLLLRVWHQDNALRCRLLSVTDRSSPPSVTTAAQGVDAICDAVRRWLLQV